jgi:hypothetical protein
VTLLLQDEHPGLEVQDREMGEWIGVPPDPAAYVVNMGDIISRITGGLYESSIHRVLNKNRPICSEWFISSMEILTSNCILWIWYMERELMVMRKLPRSRGI